MAALDIVRPRMLLLVNLGGGKPHKSHFKMKPLKGYGWHSTFTAPGTITEPRTATRNTTGDCRPLTTASESRRGTGKGRGGGQVRRIPRGRAGCGGAGRPAGSAHARPRPLYRRRHLKTLSEHARPRPPAARGAGGGAALRPGLTCPRSPLPLPAAAPADGCSCHASERLVAVVSWRRCSGTITRGLDPTAGRTGAVASAQAPPPGS